LLALTACSGAAEIPDIPDLAVLREQYRTPTGVLDLDNVNETLAQMPELGTLSTGFRSMGYATSGVEEARSSSKEEEESLRIQGSIRVTMRCPGELANPEYDPDMNGSLSLTIAVERSRIKRTIGGRADGCVLRAMLGDTPLTVEVDGPFAFDLGGDVSLRNRWSGQLLMQIRGRIRIGDELELSNLSARWTSEKFEYLFVLPDDSGDEKWVVAEVTDEGIAIRDSEQIWVCPSGEPCGI
jgi:hypothetical protein